MEAVENLIEPGLGQSQTEYSREAEGSGALTLSGPRLSMRANEGAGCGLHRLTRL